MYKRTEFQGPLGASEAQIYEDSRTIHHPQIRIIEEIEGLQLIMSNDPHLVNTIIIILFNNYHSICYFFSVFIEYWWLPILY